METTELEEYQEFVEKCKQPTGEFVAGKDPKLLKAFWVASHLSCEAGEVLEIFEKAIRKGTPVSEDKIMDECGDLLWCLTCVLNTYDLKLDDVITNNIVKLRKREDETAKQG